VQARKKFIASEMRKEKARFTTILDKGVTMMAVLLASGRLAKESAQTFEDFVKNRVRSPRVL
jgi:hypothetical protein